MPRVTDPDLLAQLEGGGSPERIVDPALLEQLEQEDGFFEGAVKSAVLGARGMGRQATNLFLPESMEPEWATKRGIEEFEAEAAEQYAKPGGTTGRFLGEAAALAPTALIGGPLVAAGGMAAKAGLPTAARALAAAGRGTGVRGAMGRAGAEGSLAGTIAAGPENRGTGALLGAGLGAGAGGLFAGLTKKIGRGAGMTDEAKALQQRASKSGKDMFIPVDQAAKGSVTRGAYNMLRRMPFAGKAMEKQSEDAMRVLQTVAAREALPEGTSMAALTKAMTPEEQGVMLKNVSTGIYNQVKDRGYRVDWANKSIAPKLDELIKANKGSQKTIKHARQVAHEVRQRMDKLSTQKGKVIGGDDLIEVKNELSLARQEAFDNGDAKLVQVYTKMREAIDDMISRNLGHGVPKSGKLTKGQLENKRILDGWEALRKTETSLESVKAAATGAKGVRRGEYKPSELSKIAEAKGAKETKELADLGYDVLEERAHPGNIEKLMANAPYFLGMTVLGSMNPILGAGALAGTLGLGRAAASKGVQKAVLGQTGPQRAMTRAVKEGSPTLRRMTRYGGTLPLTLGATRE